MNISVDLQIACEDEEQPPPSEVRRWIQTSLLHAAPATTTDPELTVRIVDEAEMRSLNATYRGKDKPTNVLSFPADIPEPVELPLLGDIVVCAPVVNREAREQQKLPQHHWAHMIIHGTLHLLGYDHEEAAEAEAMETLEVGILASLDIADPYLDTHTTKTTVNL